LYTSTASLANDVIKFAIAFYADNSRQQVQALFCTKPVDHRQNGRNHKKPYADLKASQHTKSDGSQDSDGEEP